MIQFMKRNWLEARGVLTGDGIGRRIGKTDWMLVVCQLQLDHRIYANLI